MIILVYLLVNVCLSKRVSYSCQSEYFWTGQTCLPCEKGCKCSSYMGCDGGLQCQDGWVYQDEGEKKCVQCPTGCSTCIVNGINGFICNKCQTGYQLIANICVPLSFNPRLGNVKFFGFGLWGIPYWNIALDNLPQGIEEAYSTLDCIERDSSTTFCLKCPDGSWLNEVMQCEKCGPGCSLCTSRGTCVECQSGYYWGEQTGQYNQYNAYFNGAGRCLECNIKNAKNCDSKQVLSCIDGFYLQNQICMDCLNQCLTCTDSNSCVTCKQGYFLQNNQCQFCIGNSDMNINCLECSDQTKCTKCSDTYMLINSQCYLIPMDPGCEKFRAKGNNQVICDICLNGYYLYQGTCYSCLNQNELYELCTNLDESGQSPSIYPTQCFTNIADPISSANYFLIQQTDQEINTNICVQNNNGCIKMVDSIGQCSQCADHYILNNGVCYPCSTILNCLECSYNQGVICNQCIQSNYLNNNECIQCMEGCDVCSSSNSCDICSPGYYYSTLQQCVKCSVKNCSSCPNDTCRSCLPQYFLYAQTCQLCPPGCSNCQGTQGRECTSCLKGFYLKDRGCYPGTQYCAQYNNDGTCKNCIYGAYVADNQECLPCISLGAGYVCGQNANVYCFLEILNFAVLFILLIQ
ncbi:unnamed protein product [Paramecium pentaurelia]|uniref:EGF-like domain-containing protein n=1 Tax=Paramecium pentaurelia TaxID=43138 RepID=A0A8S1U1I7_9CILI|nr:unnamed protein product [Paramecium pentaurelia]